MKAEKAWLIVNRRTGKLRRDYPDHANKRRLLIYATRSEARAAYHRSIETIHPCTITWDDTETKPC